MRLSSRLWFVGVAIAVVCALALMVSFPARQILAQREETSQAEQRLAALEADVERLGARVDALEDPEVVKALARSRLDLVEPGQESYRVVFPPAGPIPVPSGWPFLLPEPAD